MAIGFIDLTSTRRIPDKGMNVNSEPKTYTVAFGDGYEQRLQNGINNIGQTYVVEFNKRTKAEIDDITAFFENKKAVTAFDFTIPDTNGGSNETTIKVICEKWQQTYLYDDFYSASATFRRVYES